jgi:hypothetical protein
MISVLFCKKEAMPESEEIGRPCWKNLAAHSEFLSAAQKMTT